MKFTEEQKQEIYNLYMKEVDEICEDCEWVTHFTAKDVVRILLGVIEKYAEEK